ncbi:oligosaccharide flippase family protein [Curtobacterium sp. UCD-KPL2560]|uniref:oligosaccharide flippase family protein n=1 Tax=Curtobacterium sp. UCD-KPL2560 TaxID=1885315 RepID=UPI0025B76C4B|nr:oligosaccharide flippase family protein [Curtobacterium sp. UCD-KPL2560]
MGSGRRAVSITLVANMLPAALGFLSAPVLARAFPVAERGEVAAATALVLLASSCLSFGFPESLTYHFARHLVDRRLLTSVALVVLAAGSLTWIALLGSLPLLMPGDAQVQQLTRLALVALVPTLFVGAARGIAIGLQRWWLVAIERGSGAGLRLIALLALLTSDNLSQEWAVAVVSISGFAGGIAYLGLIRQQTFATTDPQRVTLRQFTSYGSRVWIGSLTGILLSRLDQAILTPIAGADALGIYVVAATIVELSLVINAAVSTVMFSRQSSSVNDEELGSAARVSTLLTFVACACIAAVAPIAIPLAFGGEYDSAFLPLCILLAGVSLANPGSVAGSGLNARGRPGLRSVALLAGLSVNILLLLSLGSQFGAVGAAVATLGGTFVAGWTNIVFLRFMYGVPVNSFVGIRRSDLRLIKENVLSARVRGAK